MRAVYVDSSVIVSLMFGEAGSDNLRRKLLKYDEMISAHLMEAEVLSAACREGVPFGEALSFINTVSIYYPSSELTDELRRVFEMSYLRGADAFHLACALSLDPTAQELHFCSEDKRQLEVAQSMGFKTLIHR